MEGRRKLRGKQRRVRLGRMGDRLRSRLHRLELRWSMREERLRRLVLRQGALRRLAVCRPVRCSQLQGRLRVLSLRLVEARRRMRVAQLERPQ